MLDHVAHNIDAQRWRDVLVARTDYLLSPSEPVLSDAVLNAPPYERSGNHGRVAMDRIIGLAMRARLTNEQSARDRAVLELLAVAGLTGWYIDRQILATAEFGHAVAVGYDWLYTFLTPQERRTVREAVLSKLVRPGVVAYLGCPGPPQDRCRPYPRMETWWRQSDSNYNLVINGGFVAAALAIAPDLTPGSADHGQVQELMTRALDQLSGNPNHPGGSVESGMAGYEGGGWREGPIYWNYATRYATLLLASLQASGLSDGDLPNRPGFARSVLFRKHIVGPTGVAFNFSDSPFGYGDEETPFLFWFAERFGSVDAHRIAESSILEKLESGRHPRPNKIALDLLLWRSGPRGPESAATTAVFENIDLATFRTDWASDATWVAIKGCSNLVGETHRQFDLGSVRRPATPRAEF